MIDYEKLKRAETLRKQYLALKDKKSQKELVERYNNLKKILWEACNLHNFVFSVGSILTVTPTEYIIDLPLKDAVKIDKDLYPSNACMDTIEKAFNGSIDMVCLGYDSSIRSMS